MWRELLSLSYFTFFASISRGTFGAVIAYFFSNYINFSAFIIILTYNSTLSKTAGLWRARAFLFHQRMLEHNVQSFRDIYFGHMESGE
jgi:hypothetical protein